MKRIITSSLLALLTSASLLAQENFNVREIGQIETGDIAEGVVVVNNLAFIAAWNSGLRIVDVTDPSNPEIVGGLEGPQEVWNLAVQGDYVYLAESRGLRVIDVSDVESPRDVGYAHTDFAADVAISGNYAFVAALTRGLVIVDISDPTNPDSVTTIDTPQEAGGVCVVGNYAYVSDGGHGQNGELHVIDVANPRAPREVAVQATPGDTWGADVWGDYLFIADGWQGLRVVDISNPQDPFEVSHCALQGFARKVHVVGDYVYVADGEGDEGGGGLHVVDIYDPENPQSVGFYDTPGRPWDVFATEDYVYLADEATGLVILQFDPPEPAPAILIEPEWLDFEFVLVTDSRELPFMIGNIGNADLTVSNISIEGNGFTSNVEGEFVLRQDESREIAVTFAPGQAGNYTATLRVFSDDPLQGEVDVNLRGIARDAFPDITVTPETLDFGEIQIYERGQETLTIRNDGEGPLTVRDISLNHDYFRSDFSGEVVIQPNASRTVTVRFTPEQIGEVEAELTIRSDDPDEGVLAVVLTGACNSEIQAMGFYNTPGTAIAVEVVGNYAYVADADGGLRIIDVSDPFEPEELGAIETGYAYDIVIHDNLAFVANAQNGYQGSLYIIDIADKENLELITVADSLYGGVFHLVIDGNYAYAGSANLMYFVDISDIENPRAESYYQFYAGGSQAITIRRDHAFSRYSNYFESIDISNRRNPQRISILTNLYGATNFGDVILRDNLAFTAAGNYFQVVDISNPGNMQLAHSFQTENGDNIYGMRLVGDYAYLACCNNGLRIIDISDLENMIEFGHFDTPGETYDVAVVGRYAYVADGSLGLRIYDVWGGSPLISLSTNEIDYEEVPLGTRARRVLTIRNEGNADLTVFGVSVEGEGFSVNQAGFVLQPDGQQRLTVNFDPDEIGDFQGTLTIHSNDPNNREQIVDLLGVGGGPTWKFEIAASVGNLTDEDNFAGGAVGAGVGFDDGLDVPEPFHSPNNFISLYFPHPEWEHQFFRDFSSDIISDTSYFHPPVSWRFEVETDQRDEVVTLDFNLRYLPDDDLAVVLEDVSAGTMVNLRTNDQYTYNSDNDDTREFRLHYGGINSERVLSTGWNLISLPVAPLDARIREVIGDDVDGQYYVYDFDVTRGFRRLNSGDTLSHGKGYWLALSNETTVDVSGAVGSDTVRIDLDQGWNLIGNPFPWTTPLAQTLFRSGNRTYTLDEATAASLVQPVLYSWDNAENDYSEPAELSPWAGDWFSVLARNVDMLLFPVADGGGRRMPLDVDEPSSENWWLTISTIMDGASDRTTTLGVAENAGDDFDARFDFPEPPRSPGNRYVTACFEHEEWEALCGEKFNRDIRSPLEGEETADWGLAVVSSDTGNVTLTWEHLHNSMPEDFQLLLIDPAAGEDIDLREIDQYSYRSGGRRDFIIRVTAPAGNGGARDLNVSLQQGWNLISINLLPTAGLWAVEAGPDVIRMFERLRIDDHNHHVWLMKDRMGRFYSPQRGFNNIPFWDLAQSYFVHADTAIEVSWLGRPIPANQDIPLEEGWNLISYFPTYELEISAPDFYGISPILDNVVIMKDGLGHFVCPSVRFSNMSRLRESQGYQVKVNARAIFNYPEECELGAAIEQPLARNRHWNTPNPTSENMSVLITSIAGWEVAAGDQIGAFNTAEELIGAGEIDLDGRCGLAVWGHDNSTNELEGVATGEAIHLKLWDSDQGRELELKTATYNESSTLIYTPDSFAILSAKVIPIVPDNFSLSQPYPNPFNSSTTLSYGLPMASWISIGIYDISGRKVSTLVQGVQPAGYHSLVWEAINLSSGLYYVRMDAEGFSAVCKITLIR